MEEICRCCACEGPSKDIISKYNWMGDEEVYSDMLKECFSVDLVHQMDYSGICEVCITQLRMAFNFKKQVLNTEEQFKRKLEELGEHKNRIKVEVQEAPSETDDNDNDHDDIPDSPDDDSDDDEFLANIKTEPEEKPKVAKKRQAKAKAPAKAKKMKVEGETSQSTSGTVGVKMESQQPRKIDNHDRNTRNKQTDVSSKDNINKLKVNELKKNQDLTVTTVNELEKHKRNLSTVLSFSNATIFNHMKSDKKSYCEYCKTKFSKPCDLKRHILDFHEDLKLNCLKKSNKFDYFLIKLDVTDLTCNICSHKCSLIDDLFVHLKSAHDKCIYAVKEQRFLQYNLPGDRMLCAHCYKSFNTFKAMYIHFNSHYRNYVCDVCQASYALKGKLTAHKRRHTTGVFKCDSCDLVFDMHHKKEVHRRVHKAPAKTFKCQYCTMKFVKLSERKEHSLAVHGRDAVLDFKCDACDRCFYNSSKLSAHKRKDHLMEKRHVCTVCAKQFFSKQKLKNHMVSHTGEKHFQCDVCFKSYSLKKVLVHHMRLHVNDNTARV